MAAPRAKALGPGGGAPSSFVVAGLALFTFVVVTTRLGVAEAGIMVALLGLLMRPRQLRFPAPFWWAMALVAWAFITAPWALTPAIAQATAIDRLKVFAVFLVVINTLRTERYLRLYILFILACFALFPLRGTIANNLSGYTLFGRAIWNQAYANPNDLGGMSLLVLGLSIAVVANRLERGVLRWMAAACAAGLVGIILLTQSRGVFIGLIVGLGPSAFSMARRRPKVLLTLVLFGVVGAAFVPSAVWTRLSGIGQLASTSTIAQADPEGSASQRWEIQKTAFRVFQDHPVAGIGLGCYPLANKLYSPVLGLRDTHDTYLNLAAELGLPGLLLWLALITSVFRHWWRARAAAMHAAVQGGGYPACAVWIERVIIGFLVSAVFGSYSGITMLYLLLGILWCAASLVLESPALSTVPSARAPGLR